MFHSMTTGHNPSRKYPVWLIKLAQTEYAYRKKRLTVSLSGAHYLLTLFAFIMIDDRAMLNVDQR